MGNHTSVIQTQFLIVIKFLPPLIINCSVSFEKSKRQKKESKTLNPLKKNIIYLMDC